MVALASASIATKLGSTDQKDVSGTCISDNKTVGLPVTPVNAAKVPVTPLQGLSNFDSSTFFAMTRGAHVNVVIIGGLQVDQYANLDGTCYSTVTLFAKFRG